MTSCAQLTPREEPASALTSAIACHDTPAWAIHRINPQWWMQYRDPALAADINLAFSESPDLQVIAARLEQAEARVKASRAATLPSVNLGYGFRPGRAQEMMFPPFDLKPWTGMGNLNWEIDLFRKLARARESAEFNRRAVFWDMAAARLLLSTRIAETRFRIYRLMEETTVIREAIAANGDILKVLRDREKQGLIAATEVHRMVAENESLERDGEELGRLELLARVELDTLRGGRERDGDATGRLPAVPPAPARPFCEVVCGHPSLLAAESRLREAFRMEEVARLDLLPSFTLKGSLLGESSHFFLDELAVWQRQIGPSLDIPIYDPTRLATLDSRRGQTNEAVATFRSTLVTVVGEIEAAYINLASRKKQYQSATRQINALAEARKNVTASFKAGLVSQIEVLESERRHREAMRAGVALKEAVLDDHLSVIRTLGGACGDDLSPPVITAERVIEPTLVESLLSVKQPGRKWFGKKNP